MSHSKLHEDNREQNNQANWALNESEEKYYSLFMTMAHGVVYQSASGEIISANPAAEKILGLTIDQMQGRTSRDPSWRAMHEDGSDFSGESHPSMVALKTGKEVHNVVMGVFNPDDEQTHWININAVPQFKSGENTPYQVYSTFEDITERKQAKSKILQNQYYLTKSQELGIIGTWELDLRQNILTWTTENYKIFGLPLGTEMNYEKFLDCIHPDDRDYVHTKWSAGLHHEPYDIEHRIIDNGMVKWVREKAEIEFDTEGNPIKAIGFTQDITKHKKVRMKMDQLNQTLEAAQKMAKIGYWSYNIETQMPTWSDQMFVVCGYEKENGVPSYSEHKETWHSDDWEMFDNAVKGCIAGNPYNIDVRIWFPVEQTYHFIKTQGFPIYDNNGVIKELFGTSQDITDQKIKEEKLRLSEERLKDAQKIAKMGYLDWNFLTNEFVWSDEAYHIYGFESQDFIPTSENIVKLVHPDDVELIQKNLEMALNEGEDYDVEHRIIRPDGNIIWLHTRGKITRDKTGKAIRMLGTVLDITESKLAEKKIEASLEEKTVLLKEIHHRVKNNLQIISSLLDLQADTLDDDQLKEILTTSQHRIKSMALIHEMFYKGNDFKNIDMKRYVGELIGNLQDSIGSGNMDVTINLITSDLHFSIDTAIPIGLLLNEFISNSYKHAFRDSHERSEGGELNSINIEIKTIDEGKYFLYYSDNGIGIPEEIDIHNTKTLGLQLVGMLVEQLHGSLELKRENRTEFKIIFKAGNSSSIKN